MKCVRLPEPIIRNLQAPPPCRHAAYTGPVTYKVDVWKTLKGIAFQILLSAANYAVYSDGAIIAGDIAQIAAARQLAQSLPMIACLL